MSVRCALLLLVVAALGQVTVAGKEGSRHEYPLRRSYDSYEAETYGSDSYFKADPVLSAKPEDEDKKYLHSRLHEAMITMAFIFFTYNIFRPNDLQLKPFGRENLVEGREAGDAFDDLSYELLKVVIDRVNPVDRALQYMAVPPECRQRAVCEGRALVARVPFLEEFALEHGWLMGQAHNYQQPLKDARTRTNCDRKYRQNCSSTPFSQIYEFLFQ